MLDIDVGDSILITSRDHPLLNVIQGEKYEVVRMNDEYLFIENDRDREQCVSLELLQTNHYTGIEIVDSESDMSVLDVGDEFVITDFDSFIDEVTLTDFGDLTEGESYVVNDITSDGRVAFQDDIGDRRTFDPDSTDAFSRNVLHEESSPISEGDRVRIVDHTRIDADPQYVQYVGRTFRVDSCSEQRAGDGYHVQGALDGDRVHYNFPQDLEIINGDDMSDIEFEEGDIVRIVDDSCYTSDVEEGDIFRVIEGRNMEPVSSRYDSEQYYGTGDDIELVHRLEEEPSPFEDVTIGGYEVSYDSDEDRLHVGCNVFDAENVLRIANILKEART